MPEGAAPTFAGVETCWFDAGLRCALFSVPWSESKKKNNEDIASMILRRTNSLCLANHPSFDYRLAVREDVDICAFVDLLK